MKQKGINRIVVGVWDFEMGKQYFEKLLGAEFAPESQDGEAAAFGVRVAMAWESGIELVSPLPDVQSPYEMRWKRMVKVLKVLFLQ